VITPEEAWRRIEPHLKTARTASSSRREALGAVLARPVAATCDQPASDVSALDGYAYAGDLPAGSALPVAGVVAAGDPPGARLEPGSALQIWTGAPIPQGADRVVGVEETEREAGTGRVLLSRPAAAGNAIRARAEIAAAGSPILAAGSRLGPAALSLLASHGVDEVEIVRPPRVAVITTGDEVVPPGREPPPGRLRDSHTDYLLAAGRRLGIELTALGIAPDDPAEIERRVAHGLEQCDVTLVCGGVSMGERDHTERALAALGVTVEFDAVAIQPGKPLVFGARGDRLLFGLPGNPASVMVAFRLFVTPALERLSGKDAAFWSDARALPLAARVGGGRGKDRFVPARREVTARGVAARPLGVRGSHDLVTFGAADLLVRVRADEPERAAGESIQAIPWE
jgi:molybdopterin molybdotransferase